MADEEPRFNHRQWLYGEGRVPYPPLAGIGLVVASTWPIEDGLPERFCHAVPPFLSSAAVREKAEKI